MQKVKCHCCDKEIDWSSADLLTTISYGEYDDIKGNRFICRSCAKSFCSGCGRKDQYRTMRNKPCKDMRDRAYDNWATNPERM